MAEVNNMTPEQMQEMIASMTPEMMSKMTSLLSQAMIAGANSGTSNGSNGSSNGGASSVPPSAPVAPQQAPAPVQKRSGAESLATIMMGALSEYIAVNDPLPIPEIAEAELLQMIEIQLDIYNQVRPKGKKVQIPKKLPNRLVAELAVAYGNVCKIKVADGSYIIGYYGEKGTTYHGIYRLIVSDTTAEAYDLNKLIRGLNYDISKKEREEVYNCILDIAPERFVTSRPELMPVGNGVYNFETGELIDYDDCRDLTFTHKVDTNYNPNAVNVIIHNDRDNTDWDVESWVKDLFDTEEESDFVWEMIHASCRPDVAYKVSVFLTNSNGSGANGKSTLCTLIESIISGGEENSNKIARLSLEDFSKPFGLSQLLNACIIMGDENNVEERITNLAAFKSIVSRKSVTINRKFAQPFNYIFPGIALECSNEFPDIKDKTDSFYRRLIPLDFKHCYTNVDRKYIADDYVKRKEVCEYCLKRIIEMGDIRELKATNSSKEAMAIFRNETNPVDEFLNTFAVPDEDGKFEFTWKFVPLEYAYDVFRAWYKDSYNRETGTAQKTFNKFVKSWVKRQDIWHIPEDKNGNITSVRPSGRMDDAELSMLQYKAVLDKWGNPSYCGDDPQKKCHPVMKDRYRAMVRE